MLTTELTLSAAGGA